MEKSAKQKQKIKSTIVTSLVGTILGALFTNIAFGFDISHLIKGAIGGFVITFLLGAFENFIFQNKFKKINFSVGLIIRTLVYVMAISIGVIFIWVIHESMINNANIMTTLRSDDFSHFILKGDFKYILLFAILTSFLINFFTQINSLLGKGVLGHYLTGRYHKPKEEERVFMFLDLSSSTTIGETLDPIAFHKFINNYFFDIDEAIVESKGEIYQYVGDEAVISWKDNKGFEDANCINCFFNARDRIDELSEKYIKEFGIVPGFKAGLHTGIVVTGEIGDSKREIVFHGDVLNTASRIQSQCNTLGKKFLISEDVLKKINLPSEYRAEPMGEFKLRGKLTDVKIYSIERSNETNPSG